MTKKTEHEDAAAKKEKAAARHKEDVAESQEEVAKELIPCPVCGTTVARGEVCGVDGNTAPAPGGEPAL